MSKFIKIINKLYKNAYFRHIYHFYANLLIFVNFLKILYLINYIIFKVPSVHIENLLYNNGTICTLCSCLAVPSLSWSWDVASQNVFEILSWGGLWIGFSLSRIGRCISTLGG